MDLCTLAENAIDRIADANRQRPTLDNDSASGSPKVNTRDQDSYRPRSATLRILETSLQQSI